MVVASVVRGGRHVAGLVVGALVARDGGSSAGPAEGPDASTGRRRRRRRADGHAAERRAEGIDGRLVVAAVRGVVVLVGWRAGEQCRRRARRRRLRDDVADGLVEVHVGRVAVGAVVVERGAGRRGG